MANGREALRELGAIGRALPSILSADFADLGGAVDPLLRAGCEILHVDVMDAHFVPNLTLGPPIVKSLRRRVPGVFLDTHLMVTSPLEYLERFAHAGSDLCTVHVEVGLSPETAKAEADRVGIGLGAAIKPGTPLEDSVRRWAPFVDLILIMSVEPGFGGQSFMPSALDRLRRTREICTELGVAPILEVDGGIDAVTGPQVVQAGAQWLVAGSAIFGAPSPVDAYRAIDGAARQSL
ncbi:MAG: ribulose-phosphate 3-epimerase [Candidatus Eisenbacteria bacterium]